MLNIVELKSKKLTELQEIAKHLDIPKFRYVNKPELIDLILKNQKKELPNKKEEVQKETPILQSKKSKKSREESYDSIRDWLIENIRKKDTIIFPKEELLNRIKLFDDYEKQRIANVIKIAVEKDGYCMKLENEETIHGDEVIRTFEKMLKIKDEENGI